MLLALLTPPALVRAVLESLRHPERRPLRALVPPTRSRWPLSGIGNRTAAWLNTAALLWADEFATSRWTDRIDLGTIDRLRAYAQKRPVLLVSLHFGGIFVLPALLRAQGIPTAGVIGGKLWPVRWWRRRRAQLTQIEGLPTHLRAGDAWAVRRYMRPGRCVLVAVDYPHGQRVEVAFGNGKIGVYTPSLRLARLTDAVVLPVIVRADSAWRFAVHIGEAVPDELIRADDHAAAMAYICRELAPVALGQPDQAMPLLARAVAGAPTP
jgi:lauroyl/myristoyl acyltransferase